MNLETLRNTIDMLNQEIVTLLAKRLQVAKEIAKVKKKNSLPIHDPAREIRQRQMLRALAMNNGLSPAVIEEMFTLFVEYTKMIEKMELEHNA